MMKEYKLDAAQRLGNAIFGLTTRLGLGAQYRWILSVPGRRTGFIRSTPVDVMNIDGERWLVAPYKETNWVLNVRAHPMVTLSRGGRTQHFLARPALGSERVDVIRQYLRLVPITAPYWNITEKSADTDIERESLDHPIFHLRGESDT